MALTNEDLQAIANLMDQKLEPINGRLDKMEGRLDKMEGRLDKMEGRLDKLDNEIDKLNSQVSALQAGQIEIRKEIKVIDAKVSETNQLALDAWGTSTENRKWLESVN